MHSYTFTNIQKLLGLTAIMTASCLVLGHASQAFASKKIYTPYVSQGEVELELRSGYTVDDNDQVDGAQKYKLAVGYGFTDWWFTELYGIFEKGGSTGSDFKMEEVEWANKFQLTEQGEYAVDVGAYIAYVSALTSGHADAVEAQLLLGKDTGALSHYANIEYKREIGDQSSDDNEIEVKWSSRYRYNPVFEPGFEIYSGFGDINNTGSFDDQSHQIGPVIYGKIDQVKYEIGYLFGVSDAAVDGEAKVVLEYEFRF